MEEIERARDEERRRNEQENRDVVPSVNTFKDDEFDAKVKSKNVNKIDLTKFGSFQKSQEIEQETKPSSKVFTKRLSRERIDISDVETVESAPVDEDLFEVKVRERVVGKLDLGSSPFNQRNSSKLSHNDIQNTEDIVLHKVTLDESAPKLEQSNNRRIVNKLDKSRFSFSSNEDHQIPVTDDRKFNRERERLEWERSLQLEREQIEHAKQAFDIPLEEGGDVITDNNIEYEPRNVRKLDMSLFSKFKQEKPDEVPVRKSSVKKEEKPNDVVMVEMVAKVESAPKKLTPEEEYELKRRSVGKLDKNMVSQLYKQDLSESKRKEAEMLRVKQEQIEIEKLRNEENRRQKQVEDVFETDEKDNTNKPQEVKRLDNSAMYPFQNSNKSPITRKKTKEEVRQERKLARKESRTKLQQDDVTQVEVETSVESTPQSFDSPQFGVGRLDKDRFLQMMGNDQDDKERRKKLLEEERVRRELEEMEQQREEELRRHQDMDDDEGYLGIISEKPQNVKKIDLSQFSQFQKKETEIEVTRKSSIKKSVEILKEEEPVQDNVVQEVESAPFSFEDEDIVIEEKPKTVGKLDLNKFTQSFSNEAEEKRKRLRELEEERVRRDNEEREILLKEQRRQKNELNITETSVEEVHSEANRFDDEAIDQSSQKTVGRLDIGRIRQSFSEEAEAHRKRLEEIDLERKRCEEEQKRVVLEEKEQRNKSVINVQDERITIESRKDVHSVPEEPNEDQVYEQKRKNVGKLDFNKITQSFGADATEKKKRFELERIQREKDEQMELNREQQLQQIKDVEEKNTHLERIDVVPRRKMNEDEMYEEKRKSVGKLDFEKITKSFGEDAEDKRRKMRELELERIRRDKEEKELLLREQRIDDDDDTEPKQNGSSYKDVSVNRLDVKNIMNSFSDQEEMSRRKALELERERRLRDEEEKSRSRQLERERAHRPNAAIQQHVVQNVESSPMEDIFFEEKPAQKIVERKTSKSTDVQRKSSYEMVDSKEVQPVKLIHYDNEDGAVQSKKSVGKLDLLKFSQSFDQEAKEREKRSREIEFERLRLEREEMEGRSVNQATER